MGYGSVNNCVQYEEPSVQSAESSVQRLESNVQS